MDVSQDSMSGFRMGRSFEYVEMPNSQSSFFCEWFMNLVSWDDFVWMPMGIVEIQQTEWKRFRKGLSTKCLLQVVKHLASTQHKVNGRHGAIQQILCSLADPEQECRLHVFKRVVLSALRWISGKGSSCLNLRNVTRHHGKEFCHNFANLPFVTIRLLFSSRWQW